MTYDLWVCWKVKTKDNVKRKLVETKQNKDKGNDLVCERVCVLHLKWLEATVIEHCVSLYQVGLLCSADKSTLEHSGTLLAAD